MLERYTRLLGSFPATFRDIAVVLERRRKDGHQPTSIARDSRLQNAPFNERYLQGFGGRTAAVHVLCASYAAEIETFARETLELTRQDSGRKPISQVDFRLFSLYRSGIWQVLVPEDVPDLLHELSFRFYVLRAEVWQLKHTATEVYEQSFGLKSAFANAMNHRSCNCHATPTVAQALFSAPAMAAFWEIEYSSREPAVRASEYTADITTLFNDFASVSSMMALFIETLYQRVDGISDALLHATHASTLSELNFRLAPLMESAKACTAMFSHLEDWLRK